MEEPMKGDDTIDLTDDSFTGFQNGGQELSDEDFAKRLQMEEYETLGASDFLVAQQLQEELQREYSRHRSFDPEFLRFNEENLAFRPFSLFPDLPVCQQQQPRRLRPVPPIPTTVVYDAAAGTVPSDDAEGAVSASIDAIRLTRVQQAMMRNRLQQQQQDEDTLQAPTVVAAEAGGGAGALDQDVPPPVPRRNWNTRRRRMAVSTVPRSRPGNGPRIGFFPFIHYREGALQLVDFEDGSGNNYDALWDLSECIGEVGHKGLSRGEINRLPTVKYRASDYSPTTPEDATAGSSAASASDTTPPSGMAVALDNSLLLDCRDCRICLGDFSDGDLLRTLPCCHGFHVKCIDQWIKRNAICPVCRDDVRGHVRRR